MRSKTLLALILTAFALPAHAAPTAGKPSVQEAWVRAPLPGQDVTAAYLTLDNRDRGRDVLLEASCDSAATVEIHRMVEAGGRMKMERIPRLEVPAGGRVVLEPGGLHLMLFGTRKSLQPGGSVRLKLRFEHAGLVEVEAAVKAAPGGKHGEGH